MFNPVNIHQQWGEGGQNISGSWVDWTLNNILWNIIPEHLKSVHIWTIVINITVIKEENEELEFVTKMYISLWFSFSTNSIWRLIFPVSPICGLLENILSEMVEWKSFCESFIGLGSCIATLSEVAWNTYIQYAGGRKWW